MTNSFTGVDSTETILFEDSGILPVQFYQARGGAGTGNALHRLMTAILVDAVHCYQAGAGGGRKDREASEARMWMFGYYPEFPFSFSSVCAEIGISPDRIRERLLLDDERIAADGRPRFLRRPAIRRLQVRSERRRTHPRALRSERKRAGFVAGFHSINEES